MNKFGFPEFVLSDNGTHFSASNVNDFEKKAGFEWKFVAAYDPRGNQRVERIVGTLKVVLKRACAENQSGWDIEMPSALRGYGLRPSSERVSPFECMFDVRTRFCWKESAQVST